MRKLVLVSLLYSSFSFAADTSMMGQNLNVLDNSPQQLDGNVSANGFNATTNDMNVKIDQKQIIINPNDPQAQLKIDEFRESLPMPDVRSITLDDGKVQIIKAKANFWTVLELPSQMKEYDILVGNPDIYEVKKQDNRIYIRPKRIFENSDLTVIVGDKIYKFILTQSRTSPDLIVRAKLSEPIDYEREVRNFLEGRPYKYLKVEELREGKKYDKIVNLNGKKYGINYKISE